MSAGFAKLLSKIAPKLARYFSPSQREFKFKWEAANYGPETNMILHPRVAVIRTSHYVRKNSHGN